MASTNGSFDNKEQDAVQPFGSRIVVFLLPMPFAAHAPRFVALLGRALTDPAPGCGEARRSRGGRLNLAALLIERKGKTP
jgi:hypothetical protein